MCIECELCGVQGESTETEAELSTDTSTDLSVSGQTRTRTRTRIHARTHARTLSSSSCVFIFLWRKEQARSDNERRIGQHRCMTTQCLGPIFSKNEHQNTLPEMPRRTTGAGGDTKTGALRVRPLAVVYLQPEQRNARRHALAYEHLSKRERENIHTSLNR